MTQKPETPAAVPLATEVSSVLSEGHPQGASGNGQTRQPEPFVSIPQIGAYRTADHRYYWNGKGPLPSVTSILSVLDKPAVVQWAKRTVAEFAVDSYAEKTLDAYFMEHGGDATVKWLASLPDYQKDEAGKLGSGVHLLADMASRASESDYEAFQVSELEKPYLASFLSFLTWLREHGGAIISSEKMVWALDGYAGTYDNLIRFTCDCHQGLWLTDTKTRKGATYPEDALQLIAYGYADQIIVEGSPDPYPMPRIDRYGILHLRPDLYTEANSESYAIGWRLIEYPLIESDYRAFLGALELYRWKQEGRYTKSKLRST